MEKMLATSDNGALARTANTIFKIDSLGGIEWANDYNFLSPLISPIETDSGYVFARYYLGGINRGGAFSIHHDGSLYWVTNWFQNFFPSKGISRRNGNILFPGSNQLNGTANFLELEYRTGNIVRFNHFKNPIINRIFASDVSENSKHEIVFAGPDNRGILQHVAIGKLNDTLSTISCQDTLVTPIVDPYSMSIVGPNPVTTSNNTGITFINYNFVITTDTISSQTEECLFTRPRGILNLGKDTSLCIGQSVILGDNTSDFDAYLWSTGSNNKTIGINQSGTYWLQVISACDTLIDSINVSYTPNVLFNLGPDVTACGDSVILGQNLATELDYLWSTGETSDTIIVKTPGDYWVEDITICISHRDSIKVSFSSKLPPINLGRDTILCPKQSILLGSLSSPYDTFKWSDSSTNKVLAVNTAGEYWLRASDSCNTSSDTIRVYYYPNIGLDLGADTSICKGKSLTLGISRNLSNYLWSTGDTTPSIVVSLPGIYWLETQTDCGPVSDSITVTNVLSIDPPVLIEDTIICEGENLILNPGNLLNYTWSTGETSPSITVTDSNLYWVETSNQCDALRDSILVSFHPPLNILYSISETIAYSGDSIQFKNLTLSGSNPIWDFGNGDSAFVDSIVYIYPTSGIFNGSLSLLTSNGCLQSTAFQINILLSEYFAPNIFSPNNDGTNDTFIPFGKDIEKFETKIYNRWGELIFNSNNTAWNGKNTSNIRAQEGVYNYIIKLSL
ncbi:MAG: gliding motility-associated C-terminal domain-containing protein [Flavobacteriales bacterium]|nr:gliding motility-associated C-terminal domain-containing protein [Flavobacteriales bacterium]